MRMLRWLGLAITLLVLHVTLSVTSGAAQGPGPLLVAMAIQAQAVVAVLLRWRCSRGEAQQLWLLLALAMLLQLFSGAAMLLTEWSGGAVSSAFALLGGWLSGMYMVPCMFLIARTFSRDTPRTVKLLDGLIAICSALLLFLLFKFVVSMPLEMMRAHQRNLIFLADAVNYSLAILALMRMAGATTRMRRHAYFVASVFLWVNALSVSVYNRINPAGLPWWGGVLLVLAFVMVVAVVMRPVPGWVLHYRPSQKLAQVIDGFAPVVLTVGVLALGISLSRMGFGTSMIVSVLSVPVYGLRMAYIHNRDQQRQYMAALSNQRLQKQLAMDPMTGIANRGALDSYLRSVLHDQRSSDPGCAVLMVDVDYFKQYNDSNGHIAGDHCLMRVVDALSSCLLRSGDLIARYGGEEFAIVLPRSTEADALKMAQRLVDAVAKQNLPHPSSLYGKVTVSVGATSGTVGGKEDQAIRLLEAADRTLYEAKRNGRNRCEVAKPPRHGSTD